MARPPPWGWSSGCWGGGGTPWGGCRPPAGPLYRYPLIAGVALQSRHQCWMFFCQARLYIYILYIYIYIYIYMEGRLSSVSSVFNQHILKYFLHHICKGTMRFRAPMKTLSILYMAWRNLQWYLILNIRPRFEMNFELEKRCIFKIQGLLMIFDFEY